MRWEVHVLQFSLWWTSCMQPESSWAWPCQESLLRGGQSCVDVLQVNVCLGILSARTCNADHGDILWKMGHVGVCMGLTTGKAWAIDWRGSVGTWKVSPHVVGCTSDVDELFRFMDLFCTGELEIVLLSHLMPFIVRQHHHLVPPWYTHTHTHTHTHTRAHTWTPHTRTCTLFSVRMAVNNRWNVSAAFFLIFLCTLLTSVACATCQSSIWHILFIVAYRHVSTHARTHTSTHTHTHTHTSYTAITPMHTKQSRAPMLASTAWRLVSRGF